MFITHDLTNCIEQMFDVVLYLQSFVRHFPFVQINIADI